MELWDWGIAWIFGIDFFPSLISDMYYVHQIIKNHTSKYAWDEKALELLLAMEKVNPNRRHKRTLTSIGDEEKEKESMQDAGATSQVGGRKCNLRLYKF